MSSRQRRAARRRPPRSATARHGARRRAPWAALAALVLAYACLLGVSPVGQAGFLWLHLATEHGEAPARPPAEHRHGGGPAHRHAAADHDHGHDHEPAADHQAGRSVPPNAPHEHHGRVHTHDRPPVEDPTVPVDALSKHYLAPDPASPPPPARDAPVAPAAAQAPPPVAPPVETPPPRRPG